jgi:hypothetical protein
MSDDAWDIDPARPACAALDDGDSYFPSGTFEPRGGNYDGLVRHWYSETLRRMGEPSLSCQPLDADTVRILVLPTSEHPFAIRLILDARSPTVTHTELDGNGGFDLGKRARRDREDISLSDLGMINSAMRSGRLWRLPIPEYNRWLIEGRTGSLYHVAYRWVPLPGPLRDVAGATESVVEERSFRGQAKQDPTSR